MKKPKYNPQSSGDFFAASVVNQKMVNQNTQQVLVAVAAQIVDVKESQFGLSSQDEKFLN